MYILVLFFPLLGFFFSFFSGFFIGREGSCFFTCLSVFFSFISSLLIFYEVVLSQSVVILHLWDWLNFGIYRVSFGLYFDSLTCVMLLVITIISFLVHLFSVGYMHLDPHLSRFMSYLSLFTFFMLFLVCSDNFVQMFLGWEGVGLCSYLLINFWYMRILANKAALKALIINRISDIIFFFSLIILFFHCGTTDFIIIFNLIPFLITEKFFFMGVSFYFVDLISFFLLVGALGKSAQLFFHVWLPDAMEGPTPVSALLHAATMVTAGVFLLARCSFIFEYSSNILFFISFIGGFTSFFFAIVSVFQFDLKKVIAYSTCSQLGYMFFSCGLSNYQVAIFHLFNHAFFKALLFLGAGSIIHVLFDEQDIRKMGSLLNFLPFTYFCIFSGVLAIVGFPFLTGFYSKDLIFDLTYTSSIMDGFFIYFLGISSSFFTVVYSVRILIFVFYCRPNFYRIFVGYIKESNFIMAFTLFFLSIFSIFFGFFFYDGFVGWGTFFWNDSLFVLPLNFCNVDSSFVSPFVKNIPIFLCVLGSFFCLIIYDFFLFDYCYFFDHFLSKIIRKIVPFFFYAGFFNMIYNDVFLFFFKFSYEVNTKVLDKGFFEFVGPFGLYKLFQFLNFFLRLVPLPIMLFLSFIFFFFFSLILFFFLFFHVYFFLFVINNFGIFLLLIFVFVFDLFKF